MSRFIIIELIFSLGNYSKFTKCKLRIIVYIQFFRHLKQVFTYKIWKSTKIRSIKNSRGWSKLINIYKLKLIWLELITLSTFLNGYLRRINNRTGKIKSKRYLKKLIIFFERN